MKLLIIDSTIKEKSKTKELLDFIIKKLDKNIEINRIILKNEDLKPLNEELLNKRDQYIMNKDFSDEMFKYAKAFSSADKVIIAAPFYDLSFPSILKIFIEQIMVFGLTFIDGDKGVCGIHNVKGLLYLYTRGMKETEKNRSVGEFYLKSLSNMLEIPYFNSFGYSSIEYEDINRKLNEDSKEIDILLNEFINA